MQNQLSMELGSSSAPPWLRSKKPTSRATKKKTTTGKRSSWRGKRATTEESLLFSTLNKLPPVGKKPKISASITISKLDDMMRKEKFKGSKEFTTCMNKVDKLLNHPRNNLISQVKFSEFRKAYLVSGPRSRYYPGLTKTLRAIFYPDTSDDPIERTARNKELGGRAKNSYVPSGMKTPCSLFGKAHGSLVHSQFEMVTECIKQSKSFESIDKLFPDGMDPCVAGFIEYCKRREWFPLRSEFMIYHEQYNVATGIDMLLLDTVNWKLISAEFKTGYEGEEYEEHDNDTMLKPPLDMIINCPKNRHFLQSIVPYLILKEKYGVILDEMYTVRLCPKMDIIETYTLEDWCLDKNILNNIDFVMGCGE